LWLNLRSAWVTIKHERHIIVWIRVTIGVVSRPEKYWRIYKEANARVAVKTTPVESATAMESATATMRVGASDTTENRECRDTSDCKFLHPGLFHAEPPMSVYIDKSEGLFPMPGFGRTVDGQVPSASCGVTLR
jgi:hypothetical protein